MADNEGDPWVEQRLLRAKGAPPPPSKAVARKVADPVPVTSTGEHAGDIVGAWVAWYSQTCDVPVPGSIVSRMGKQVKTLIVTGFTTDEIKFGLAAWTLKQLDFPGLSPTALDMLVFSYARDTRAGAAEFREKLRRGLAQLSNDTFRTGDTKDDRETSTLRAINNYRRKDRRK